jgi:hypothetical protein
MSDVTRYSPSTTPAVQTEFAGLAPLFLIIFSIGLAVGRLGYPSAFLIGAGAALAALIFLMRVVGAKAKP